MTGWKRRGVVRAVGVVLALTGVSSGLPPAHAAPAASRQVRPSITTVVGAVRGATPATATSSVCGSGRTCGTPTASGCTTWKVWRTERHQGITDYHYQVNVHFCWRNRVIRRGSVSVSSSLTNIAVNINDDGNTEADNAFYDYWPMVGRSGHSSLYQRHVQYCAGWFCYDHEDPWIHVYVHGDGTMSFHTGTR